MQKKKALRLREEWDGKPCPHPSLSREYDLGEHTGGYVCTQCGESLTWRQKSELQTERGT